VPFSIFGPRLLKLACFWVFTAFQLVNLPTANYGFFVYLALALHVFLLSDRDIERLTEWLPRPLRARRARQRPPRRIAGWERAVRLGGALVVATLVGGLSTLSAIEAFVPTPPAWAR
jgi:hypothetical protein